MRGEQADQGPQSLNQKNHPPLVQCGMGATGGRARGATVPASPCAPLVLHQSNAAVCKRCHSTRGKAQGARRKPCPVTFRSLRPMRGAHSVYRGAKAPRFYSKHAGLLVSVLEPPRHAGESCACFMVTWRTGQGRTRIDARSHGAVGAGCNSDRKCH